MLFSAAYNATLGWAAGTGAATANLPLTSLLGDFGSDQWEGRSVRDENSTRAVDERGDGEDDGGAVDYLGGPGRRAYQVVRCVGVGGSAALCCW